MKRVVWLSDIHLNFARTAAWRRFTDEVRAAQPDLVLIGGDIGEAKTLVGFLERLAAACEFPVAFVLGNHDYYGGSLAGVHDAVRELCARAPQLTWLPDAGVVRLTDEVSLLGHGGWGDARAGQYANSNVILNDYVLIDDLRTSRFTPLHKLGIVPDVKEVLNDELQCRLMRLGDEAAHHLAALLPQAVKDSRQVIVLMHVPPFRGACWYQQAPSDDNWAPHFVCQAAGEVLLEVAAAHPDRELLVLCGHTHGGGEYRPRPNLTVLTAEAEYGRPQIQRIFEVT